MIIHYCIICKRLSIKKDPLERCPFCGAREAILVLLPDNE